MVNDSFVAEKELQNPSRAIQYFKCKDLNKPTDNLVSLPVVVRNITTKTTYKVYVFAAAQVKLSYFINCTLRTISSTLSNKIK